MILIAEKYKQQRDKNDIIRKKNTNRKGNLILSYEKYAAQTM